MEIQIKGKEKMSRISYYRDHGGMDITVPPELEEEFRTLVRRAMATWQDVSYEMRDFSDRVQGIDTVVGNNMKHNHHTQVRSCCGTLLIEPHHTQCIELSKLHHTTTHT